MLLDGLVDPNYYVYKDKVYYELPAKLLWSLTHYDGPMTCIAYYRGKYCYGKCHQSTLSRKDRYFWLYPLTAEEFQKESAYQEWFREYYGFHCDYDGNNCRGRKPKTLKERWWEWTRSFKKRSQYHEKLNELKINREEYTNREAIGFCTRYSLQEHLYNQKHKKENPERYNYDHPAGYQQPTCF